MPESINRMNDPFNGERLVFGVWRVWCLARLVVPVLVLVLVRFKRGRRGAAVLQVLACIVLTAIVEVRFC